MANNVLHWNNEQELIVAQKVLYHVYMFMNINNKYYRSDFYLQMIQSASRFIRALETYGVQAARVASFQGDRNLAIFTTENVGE